MVLSKCCPVPCCHVATIMTLECVLLFDWEVTPVFDREVTYCLTEKSHIVWQWSHTSIIQKSHCLTEKSHQCFYCTFSWQHSELQFMTYNLWYLGNWEFLFLSHVHEKSNYLSILQTQIIYHLCIFYIPWNIDLNSSAFLCRIDLW